MLRQLNRLWRIVREVGLDAIREQAETPLQTATKRSLQHFYAAGRPRPPGRAPTGFTLRRMSGVWHNSRLRAMRNCA